MAANILAHGLAGRIARFTVLVVLILETSCAPAGPVIRVEASSASVQVNGETRVPVTVENITDLTAFEIHLSFDSSALEVTDLKEGGFIKADFTVQNSFDNAAGTIDYAVAQINHPPANGNGTLLEIVLHAKAHGKSPVRFRATQAAPAGA